MMESVYSRERNGLLARFVCGARGGFVLYAILIVVMLSSMVAVSLLYATKSAETAAAAGVQGEQAWVAAMCGVNKAIQVAMLAEPGSADWQDAEDSLKDQFVFADGGEKWYYTVYSWSRTEDEDDVMVYGLQDEAAKLNLKYLADVLRTNAVDSALFSALNNSGAEDEAEGGTLDAWMVDLGIDDSGTNALGSGWDISEVEEAEETSIPEGTSLLEATEDDGEEESKKVDFEKLEIPEMEGVNEAPGVEFLDGYVMSLGYGTRVLYGKDLDMNLKADETTKEVGEAFQEGTESGLLGMGLRHFLTTSSYDLNVSSTGEARVNLNDKNADLSMLGLSDKTVEFVEAMWRKGERLTNPAVLLTNVITAPMADGERRGEGNQGSGQEQEYRVELTESEMDIVFDCCTTTDAKYLPGLVNVNTAPAEVLEVLFGDSEEAEAAVSARESLMGDELLTPGWLVRQGVLSNEKFMRLYPYMTARSWQFHFYVIGYAVPSGRYRILEVIVDTACEVPQPVLIRDLTRLGMPFKVENDGSQDAGDSAAEN